MTRVTWVAGVTRGDGTEGEEEKKGEGGEEGEILAGRDGPTEGTTRGPRGPKNALSDNILGDPLWQLLH